ncbi:hypothetical protein [Hoeflea sp. IMCC20628]|nr:hypothetical protein [Hoeflea sp. IMCC20628]
MSGYIGLEATGVNPQMCETRNSPQARPGAAMQDAALAGRIDG